MEIADHNCSLDNKKPRLFHSSVFLGNAIETDLSKVK